MRRRSDRGKTKQPEPSKEESPEKSSRKSHRHSRRRKKSSSSSEEAVEKSEVVQDIPPPQEMQVKDIELPQGEQCQPANASDKTSKPEEETKPEWKEDNAFWESEGTKSTQEPEEGSNEKEESSLWKVQSANGGGGEIQKLKICRQRPTESPEIGESSLHKRLSRGNKDGRSTDDSTHDESERDIKKSKHKTRTSSRNSPLVSPTVVCDLSEDSPTKIKIINVGNINSESKTGNVPKPDGVGEIQEQKAIEIQEDSQMSDTLDIALPVDEPPPPKQPEAVEEKIVSDSNESKIIVASAGTNEDLCKSVNEKLDVRDDTKQFSPKKSTSASPSPKNEPLKSHTSGSSSDDSDASKDESKPRKVKKKRRRELQSMVQRKNSSSASPKRESSSDSEDDGKKKAEEADQRKSTDSQGNNGVINDKESEVGTPLASTKENKPEETNGDKVFERRPMPRKRRWGSSSSSKFNKRKQIINISTESLKSLLPDAKPVPLEELQLSMEEEEGQLDDDDEDDDEVVAMVTKEEEKQLEQERERDEKQKEKEKEMEDKRRRQERFEKNKHEQVSPEQVKVEIPRKIHLITDDAKKLTRSPSPPRRKPTSVLYITHLVRPFTVQQLKNLLLRTGQIAENGFWIDKIKSKCYVQYTTEDAAVETRHALHGVRWPTSNPKTLVVEFASHDDMVMAQALSEEPEVPRKAEPLNMVEGWVADQARIKERSRRAVVREWDVGKPEHPDEILEHELKMKEKKEQERRARKERQHHSATPEAEPPNRKARRKEEDAPAKLLDDLFRKTKVSPCIYWLPLTQEQISVKEEIRRQHMAEHERRMAELKKVEFARRDREKRNRK